MITDRLFSDWIRLYTPVSIPPGMITDRTVLDGLNQRTRFNPSRDDHGLVTLPRTTRRVPGFNPSRDDHGPGVGPREVVQLLLFQSLQG